MLDEKANIFKVQTDPESMDVDAMGISVKVGVHYPGRSDGLLKLLAPRGGRRSHQKSAEGIVGLSTRPKARTCKKG